MRSVLIGIFATMALALAGIGIYGVIAFSVVRRTQEIGIRAALGASPMNLVRLVLGGGMRLAAIGVALGGVAAIGADRALGAFLFGVGSADALTLVATAGVLAAVAALACYIPARHATRIDPLAALRVE
jgi:putative ABC transport system permease protein